MTPGEGNKRVAITLPIDRYKVLKKLAIDKGTTLSKIITALSDNVWDNETIEDMKSRLDRFSTEKMDEYK